MEILKTFPGQAGFNLFEQVPQQLYPEGSSRFVLGHEPTLAHLEAGYVLQEGNNLLGRFAFYQNPALVYQGHSAACLGSYECVDDISVSHYLLSYAKQLAKSTGYTWLIGPMEGSTWNSYRFSAHHEYPNFFMEPYHHLYYNDQFQKAGFEVIQKYHSSTGQLLDVDPERWDAFEKQHAANGMVFRNLDVHKLSTELQKIGLFSNQAFKNNFLFTPMDVSDFTKKYIQMKHFLDPALVVLAEDDQQAIQAMLFAVKNHGDPSGKSLIIKTLVRNEDQYLRGMGTYLNAKIQQEAKKLGYEQVIYAMVLEQGQAEKVVPDHLVEAFKQYQLYGVAL